MIVAVPNRVSLPRTVDEFGMKQWFPPPEDRDPLAKSHRAWSGKLGVWVLLAALAGMFSLVSLLVFTTPLARNELGLLGGLRLTAGEGTTVFVGDRKVGTGTVDVAWNELLGATGRPPLAVAIDAAASDIELPALLGAAGASVVFESEGPTGTHRGKQNANFAFRQMVLRRETGELDHLELVDVEFPEVDSDWRRIIIPIRARQLGKSATEYFPQPGAERGGNVSRGMIPSRRDHATFELKVDIDRGAPPTQLAGESAEKPLWAPDSQ